MRYVMKVLWYAITATAVLCAPLSAFGAAPVITNLAVTAMTSTTVTIQWTTDQPATSRLLYGVGNIAQGTPIDSTLTTSHSITLSGLYGSVIWNYAALSANSAGEQTQSSTQQFEMCDSSENLPLAGTVNNYYQYGTYAVAWVNTSGHAISPTVCGAALTQSFNGALSGNGSFSQTVPNSLEIVPSPSQWQVTATDPGALAPVTTQVAINPSSLDVSAALQAAAQTAGLTNCMTLSGGGGLYPSSCGGGTGMVYPSGTGIPEVTSGSAWGTTLTPATLGGFLSGRTGCSTVGYVWSPASEQCFFVGNSGVTSLNSLTGALSLTSSDSTVTITPSGTSINLSASGAAANAVQYNPTTTAYIFASFSGLYNDGDSGETALPVSSVSCDGGSPTTCTVNFTSAHGLYVSGAVDMSNLTSWPANSPFGTVQQAAQYGSFQIATVPTTTSLTFKTPTVISYTCSSSCGNAYDASWWAIWQFAREPYIYGHGTVYGLEVTAASLASGFTSAVSGITGTPKYLIMQVGQNDFSSGDSVAGVWNNITSIYTQAHAAGMVVVQTTMVPASYGSTGIGSKATFLNYQMYQTQCALQNPASYTGACSDRYVDTAAALSPGGGTTLPNAQLGGMFANAINAVFGVQGTLATTPPLWGSYSPNGLAGNYTAIIAKNFWDFYDGNGADWMRWDGSGHIVLNSPDNASPTVGLYFPSLSSGNYGCGAGMGLSNTNYFAECFHYNSGSTPNQWTVGAAGDAQGTLGITTTDVQLLKKAAPPSGRTLYPVYVYTGGKLSTNKAEANFVQYVNGTRTGSTSTLSFSSSTTSGNVLYVTMSSCSTISSPTLTDSLGTTFTQVQSLPDSGNQMSVISFIGTATSTGTDTLTISGVPDCNTVYWASEWTGVTTTGMSSTTATTSDPTVNAPLTVTTGPAVVVAVGRSAYDNRTYSTYSPYEIIWQSSANGTSASLYGYISAPGTATPYFYQPSYQGFPSSAPLAEIIIALPLAGSSLPATISPLSYGAKCDASWNAATSTYTGTDDREAFKSMVSAMVASGARIVELPQGQNCRIDPPGGVITAFSIASNVVTIQMRNSLDAGEIVTPQGLSTGTYLNGAPLVVLSTGLSTTQFEATFYHADVSSTSDAGFGVAPALEFGTTPYEGFVWTAAQGTNGNNGHGFTSAATPMTASISSGPHGTSDSTGPLFQFSYDKSANITSWSLDGSGNLTVNFTAMPGGLTFTAGESIVVSNTGTVDATYHSVATSTSTQITVTGVSGSAASGTGGLLHSPWTNADFDGVQGAEWDNITMRSYSRVSPANCAQAWFDCEYIPGSYGVLDYRGGNMILNNVYMANLQYAFFGVQSDFDYLNNLQFTNGYAGVYLGPDSTPFYANRYNDFGDDFSFWIDGLNYQGANIQNSHFRSGSASTAQIIVANKEYDSTAAAGGGLPSTGIYLSGDDFEFGGGCPGTSTPLSFVSIDYASGAATSTKDVHIISPTFVNYASSPCNVVDFIRVGKVSGGPAAIDLTGVGATNGTFTNLINYTGTTGTLQGTVVSPNLAAQATNVALATGGGSGAVAVQTFASFAPLFEPTFTGQVTLDSSGSYTDLVIPYIGTVNLVTSSFGCAASTNCLYTETGGSSPYSTTLYAAQNTFGTRYASFGSGGVHIYNSNGAYLTTTGLAGDPGSVNAGQEWFNTTTSRRRFYTGSSMESYAWLSDITITGTNPTFANGVNANQGMTIKSGSSATQNTYLTFTDYNSTAEWEWLKDTANNMSFYDSSSVQRMLFQQANGTYIGSAGSQPIYFNQRAHTGTGGVEFYSGGSSPTEVLAIDSTGKIQSLGTQSISGCSLSRAVGGAFAGSFVSGTTGTCTVTLSLVTPSGTNNGWSCWANDITTPADLIHQGASNNLSVTLSGTTVSGDTINYGCIAY